MDSALSRASPFTAAGVVVGTVYWSAVTYGAVTVMQVHDPLLLTPEPQTIIPLP